MPLVRVSNGGSQFVTDYSTIGAGSGAFNKTYNIADGDGKIFISATTNASNVTFTFTISGQIDTPSPTSFTKDAQYGFMAISEIEYKSASNATINVKNTGSSRASVYFVNAT